MGDFHEGEPCCCFQVLPRRFCLSPNTGKFCCIKTHPSLLSAPSCSGDHRLPEWLLEASPLHALLQQVGMQPVAPDVPDHL